MRLNTLYGFLKLDIDQTFNQEQLVDRFGNNYFLIPLPLISEEIELTNGHKFVVIDNHLSCFEHCLELKFFSDVHYTCNLQSELGAFKVHVYLNGQNESVKITFKNIDPAGDTLIITQQEQEILKNLTNQRTNKLLCFLRTKKNEMLKNLELVYQQQIKQLENTVFNDLATNEEQRPFVEEIIATVMKCMALSPRKYQKVLKRLNIHNELLQIAEVEPAQELKHAITTVAEPEPSCAEKMSIFGPVRNILNEKLFALLRNISSFEAESLSITKTDRHEATNAITISPMFVQHVTNLKTFISDLNTEILAISEMQLLPSQRKILARLITKANNLEHIEHLNAINLLNTMVAIGDFNNLDLVKDKAKYLSGNAFLRLVNQDLAEPLWDLIVAGKINIYSAVSPTNPQSILEEIIKKRKYKSFRIIHQNSFIDFLMQCSEGRPLLCLILQLNPVNLIRSLCVATHPYFSSAYFLGKAEIALRQQMAIVGEDFDSCRHLEVIAALKNNTTSRIGYARLERCSAITLGNRDFLLSARASVEEIDFLKEAWFQSKISEFKRKINDHKKYLQKIHQSHLLTNKSELFNDNFTDERSLRMTYLIESMTKQDAQICLEMAMDSLDKNIEYHELIIELRTKEKCLGKKERSRLMKKAERLKKEIDSYTKVDPMNVVNMEYPGLPPEIALLLKDLDRKLYDFCNTKNHESLPSIIKIAEKIMPLIDSAPPSSWEFLCNYSYAALKRIQDITPERFKFLFDIERVCGLGLPAMTNSK